MPVWSADSVVEVVCFSLQLIFTNSWFTKKHLIELKIYKNSDTVEKNTTDHRWDKDVCLLIYLHLWSIMETYFSSSHISSSYKIQSTDCYLLLVWWEHQTCHCADLQCSTNVTLLVIKEDVRLDPLQCRTFVSPSHKHSFIKLQIPGVQSV